MPAFRAAFPNTFSHRKIQLISEVVNALRPFEMKTLHVY